MTVDETQVDISEFARLDLRTGTTLAAEAVQGSDKLVLMRIDIGGEVRQIVAGIRTAYPPESLVGKKVVVLANLKKAIVRGVESHGMILAADAPEGPCLLRPEAEIDNGLRVR
ncbi:MAG TPA: methionine--tRNA ligase [bacterium]|nr:methionine--tRNA ligase [bacterium]HPI78576.1 methionine--tRNA ligase [bacterium]